MENVERWIRQSPLSDPASHAGLIFGLPSAIGALNRIVQGLLIHSDWLTLYGLVDEIQASRRTLPVAERLEAIRATDSRDLRLPRPPDRRAVGTCRDFALLLCAFLRDKGIPARVRCGFASYFARPWEDHWVCEYWDRQTQCWRLSDAQLDSLIAANCHIEFEPTDVPRRVFMTAGEAWQACRNRTLDPNQLGHGDITGAWFVKINVIRDHFALNHHETSAWDGWRAVSTPNRVIETSEVAVLDNLAASPGQQLIELVPYWLG